MNKILLSVIGILIIILTLYYFIEYLFNKKCNLATIDNDLLITYILSKNEKLAKCYANKTTLTPKDKNIIFITYILEKNPILSDYISLSDNNLLDYTTNNNKTPSDFIISSDNNLVILEKMIRDYMKINDIELLNYIDNNKLGYKDIKKLIIDYINKNDIKLSEYITKNGIEMKSISEYIISNNENINNINNLLDLYISKINNNEDSITQNTNSIIDINNRLGEYITKNDILLNNYNKNNTDNYNVLADNLVNVNVAIRALQNKV